MGKQREIVQFKGLKWDRVAKQENTNIMSGRRVFKQQRWAPC